jgi:hypothetical protein
MVAHAGPWFDYTESDTESSLLHHGENTTSVDPGFTQPFDDAGFHHVELVHGGEHAGYHLSSRVDPPFFGHFLILPMFGEGLYLPPSVLIR